MNKAAIKAELRRSACEDDHPYWDINIRAWARADKFGDKETSIYELSRDDQRTFFLFVAEAL